MDDPALTEPRPGGAGRTVGWIALGLIAGLAAGWLVWRGGEATPGDGSAPESAAGVEYVHGVDVSNDPVLGPPNAPITKPTAATRL